MIRLTSYTSGKAVSVSPELIKIVIEDENFTYIHFGPDDDYIKVSESREEVARKVLEWRLAMERYRAALITGKKEVALAEYQHIKQLSGLEEPNIVDLQSGKFDNTEVECLRSQVNNLTALLREAGVMEEWIKKALSNNELNCT